MDDLTEDRTIDEHDALMMYYAYEFSDLSGMVGHQALRTLLLNGLGFLDEPHRHRLSRTGTPSNRLKRR